MSGKCQDCRWAHQGTQMGASALFCRRYPPMLIVRDQPAVEIRGFREPQPGGMAMFGWHPPVPPEGSCGEYQDPPQVAS
jgi:hypothetical protein